VRHLLPIVALSVVTLGGCNGSEPSGDGPKGKTDGPTTVDSGTPTPTDTDADVDHVAHAIRASLALRGLRPTDEELAQVEADPSSLDGLVDEWLDTEAFGDTVADMHAQFLQVRADSIEDHVLPAIGPLEGHNVYQMFTSLSEAPLDLTRQIVMEDRPYSDIVTTDRVRTHRIGSIVYNTPYDEELGGWQDTYWTDSRPNAGLLTASEVWRRHESAGANFHRARANFIADMFLCADFASRDVSVEGGITLSDEFEVANAVRTDPLCISCHQAMDPLAVTLFGFKKQVKRRTVSKGYLDNCGSDPSPDPLIPYTAEEFCYPVQMFNPEDEDRWQYWDLREPGYYGVPVDDIGDIGAHIAEDPRFTMCTARRWHGYLTQSDPFDLPLEEAAELRDQFVDADLSAKELAKLIVLSDRFRDAPPQLMRPEQLSRQVEHLTGFRWWVDPDKAGCLTGDGAAGSICWETVDLMGSDRFGFRAMAGGINGFEITVPSHTFTPPRELVLERFLSDAAGWVVARDFGRSLPTVRGPTDLVDGIPEREEPLLTIAPEETDPEAVKQQIAELYVPLMSRRVDASDPEVEAVYTLWADKLARSGSPDDAWAFAITALWLDPLALSY